MILGAAIHSDPLQGVLFFFPVWLVICFTTVGEPEQRGSVCSDQRERYF